MTNPATMHPLRVAARAVAARCFRSARDAAVARGNGAATGTALAARFGVTHSAIDRLADPASGHALTLGDLLASNAELQRIALDTAMPYTGALGLVGNIVWFVLAGVWLALGHVVSAVACFCTIIGIPFGIQHLKLAGIALAPVGKTIVSTEVAAAAREANARAHVTRMRGD